MVGECVRPSQETAWDMDDFQVKICKVKQPLGLAMIEVLCLTEVCQVLVICRDLDREGGSMEIVSPGFWSADDCKEFPIIDIIVLLC